MESEETLTENLELYKEQLNQIENCIKSSTGTHNNDLIQLKEDLIQLVTLTEESLLSVKKCNLLNLIESNERTNNNYPNIDNNSFQSLDDEFNKFQNEIGNEIKIDQKKELLPVTFQTNGNNSIETNNDFDNAKEETNDKDCLNNGIFGVKCRAPFSHGWGEMSYHNAIILGADEDFPDSKVKVLFCNPTHDSMKVCPYFMDDQCKFDDSICRYSHGHTVLIEDLTSYDEPDFQNIKIGNSCMAKDSDDLWYKATIVDILENDQVQVTYNVDNSYVATLKIEHIYPILLEESENEDENSLNSSDDNDENLYGIPSTSFKTSDKINIQTSDMLGQWEEHTRGIGSKLMLKMGYVIGEGLGKNSDGRAVPVPVEILPIGKSLDQIMKLKEKYGSKCLKTNKINIKDTSIKKSTIFDSINKKISKRYKNHQTHPNKNIQITNISTLELSKKSDTHINVQLLKTEGELKKSEQEMRKLKDGFKRSITNRDEVTSKKIESKIKNLEAYQNQLRTSEKYMNQQKLSRKAHKELIKF